MNRLQNSIDLAKSSWNVLRDDKQLMEMYKVMPDGKEFKVMELTFTRSKAKPAAK